MASSVRFFGMSGAAVPTGVGVDLAGLPSGVPALVHGGGGGDERQLLCLAGSASAPCQRFLNSYHSYFLNSYRSYHSYHLSSSSASSGILS